MLWILSSLKFGTSSTRLTEQWTEMHCRSNLNELCFQLVKRDNVNLMATVYQQRQMFVMTQNTQNPPFRSMNQQVVLTFFYRKFFSSSEDLGIETLHPTTTRDEDRNGEPHSDTFNWKHLPDWFRVVCYNIVTNKQKR